MLTAAHLRSALKSSASFDWAKAAGVGMSLLAALPLLATSAFANPVGAAVATGSASIASSANKTQIDQKSEDIVIDWSSFNVGAGQTTQFVQPNAQAIAVNRIGGNSASQILGTLDANGRIVLINGNGMLFGKSSQVNVGSLVATSTDGSDSDVMSGKFTRAGNQNAAIVNQGSIRARQGGLVALVAPSVTNAGTITAKFGTVAVGAANKFTVDFTGDGLVSFAAQGDVNGNASAINTGSLAGANVSLTAHAAEGVATGVVSMSGIISAQTAKDTGGTITLDAGGGSLTLTGKLDAAGKTGGGSIETSGNQVDISGTVTAGRNGRWEVDPVNLTVNSTAATTIDGSLNAGTNVELKTTKNGASGPGTTSPGPGDITIASALSWSSTAQLDLYSYHSIFVDADVSATDKGRVNLEMDKGGSGGILAFNDGDISFAKTTSVLTVEGTNYKLVNSIATLASDIATDPSGDFGLAGNYSAVGKGTYSSAPIATDFTGTFEGLGNTITGLSISDNTNNDNVGLFAMLGSGGTIRDLGLLKVEIVGQAATGSGVENIGALVGYDDGGIIAQTYVFNGLVEGSRASNVGGLVGYDLEGLIEESNTHVTTLGAAAATVGGLVGLNGESTAAGTGGTITQSSATATVGGGVAVGGLVGENNFGAITQSFATGTVSGNAPTDEQTGVNVGGFVGENNGGSISESYATGAASGGTYVGGFAGASYDTEIASTNYVATIDNSYATGRVEGAALQNVGGFVGILSGTIAHSYSSGEVTGNKNYDVGSFVGIDAGGGISDSFWDSTNTNNPKGGCGNINNCGPTGLSTVQLQSGLPGAFNATIWGENASINGGLPYLLALPPN